MEVIGKCPVCHQALTITKLHCAHCQLEITGDFEQSRFSKLSTDELKFVETFLWAQGNIKVVEKELQISYPTVKKQLDQVIRKLQLTKPVPNALTREEVMAKVVSGELTVDEAAQLL